MELSEDCGHEDHIYAKGPQWIIFLETFANILKGL